MPNDTHSSHPWTTLGFRWVYENPWIRVREDQVLSPTGNPGIYGLVKFRNQAVAIVPIDAQGHTWLVGQHRYALDQYSWEVPMGGYPVGESPLEGAHKELREETGLRAATMTELMRVHLSNSVTDEVGVAFLAQQLSQGETDFDPTEQLAIKRLPFDEALAMTLDGRITDLFSIAVLQRIALQRTQFGF
ncbi:MAG: ADP-ribose pyrophosphatase [Motiliproteus sp.]|jgi:ADP-ribose pyrophosphatase